jgi:hypothetical protein
MAVSLGNDIGCVWIDLETGETDLAAGVFPAGVDDKDFGHGTPGNQARRHACCSPRALDHRQTRRVEQLHLLIAKHLFPGDQEVG